VRPRRRLYLKPDLSCAVREGAAKADFVPWLPRFNRPGACGSGRSSPPRSGSRLPCISAAP